MTTTRRFRTIALQFALLAVVGGLIAAAAVNAANNLAAAHIASGFKFWNNTAGFDISQTLIDYSPSTSTFGRAFWVGLCNTLLVAGLGTGGLVIVLDLVQVPDGVGGLVAIDQCGVIRA
jgi:ABC-type amino acid transport system permease subunit